MPDVDFAHGWSSYSSNTGDNTNNAVGVDAALRFYLQDWKGVRFYLTPRYGYTWNNTDTLFQNVQTITSELHNHSVSGSWGLEYPVSDRISLFGDIGIKYNRTKIETSGQLNVSSGSKINSIGTVGTWGLILYLK